MLDSGDLITAVRASMSLPGIFRTEVHGDQVLVDGGCVNPVPFDLLQDCDVSIGIDVQRDHEAATGETPNLFDAMFLTYQIMEESIIRSKLAYSHPSILISPLISNVRVLDFHKAGSLFE